MKKLLQPFFSLFIFFISASPIIFSTGCANMIPPSGGPRDSLPPVLLQALPKDSTLRFTGDRITLTFNEFMQIENAFENVLVSPTPKNIPIINVRLREVNIRIKDTLEPNTTYAIDFGNALKDINEGNILKNFTYVFSTGNYLDSNTISGKVILAETGKIDTTLLVVLHRSLDDSAVAKENPRYITKLDGKGNFQFRYLPEGTFAIYAIPNEFSHHYDDTTKPFAFADNPVNTAEENEPITLYAYELARIDTGTAKAAPEAPAKGAKEDKQLRFYSNLESGRLDLLSTLEINFNKKIAAFDTTKLILANETLQPLPYTIVPDTNRTRFTIRTNWVPDQRYNLIFDTTAFADSAGVTLTKNDTLKFQTKRIEDYGSVRLRFRNLDLTKNPVLQLVKSEKVIESVPLTQAEWSRKLFEPGDYEMRILYDNNKNGKWDPGNFFGEHLQPERVITLDKKLNVRANWDNESDITL